MRLTNTVNNAARGKDMTMGSMVSQGRVLMMTTFPVRAWHIPTASADFLKPKSSQNRLIKLPPTNPAMAPALVARFQKRAATYIDKKAAAVIPNHMDVPTAMMLVGSMNPRITAITTATRIPTRAIRTEEPFFLSPLRVS